MTDTLSELEALLPDLPAGVEHRRLGHHLKTTLEALSDAERMTAKLAALLTLTGVVNYAKTVRGKDYLDELLDEADDLATAMTKASGPEDVRGVKEKYDLFSRRFASFDRMLRAHLKSVLDEEFGGLLAIGRVFEGIDSTADFGVRLVSCAEEARNCADTVSAENLPSAVERLRASRSELDAERAAVVSDPEVAVFIDALIRQEATLRLLTRPVLNWLADHGALDNFAVRGA